jgi:hypothetical protein
MINKSVALAIASMLVALVLSLQIALDASALARRTIRYSRRTLATARRYHCHNRLELIISARIIAGAIARSPDIRSRWTPRPARLVFR